jgi:hypothetical protein
MVDDAYQNICADRVEVVVDLKGRRVSGPPVVFKE